MLERSTALVEREKTHGDFTENARISQELKKMMLTEGRPQTAVFREALDMICLKLARILSGQGTYRDHWNDISGYALLAAEECDRIHSLHTRYNNDK